MDPFTTNAQAMWSRTTDPAVHAKQRMFACGTCAHKTPDHRWGDGTECLVTGCTCKRANGDDPKQTDAAWDAAIAAIASK